MRKRLLLCLPFFLMPLLAATAFAQANPTVFGLEDSDGDGLEDELEFQLGSDPTHPDTDADGWSDLIELVNGTDPCDANDHPQLTESNGPMTPTTRGAQRREAARQSAGLTLPGRRSPGNAPPSSLSLRYYHLPGFNPDLAAELQRQALVGGEGLVAHDADQARRVAAAEGAGCIQVCPIDDAQALAGRNLHIAQGAQPVAHGQRRGARSHQVDRGIGRQIERAVFGTHLA
jgi:hypothetical protein